MTLRRYQTNRWVWGAASLAVFIAIGAGLRVPIKGVNVLVARRLVEIVKDLLSGQEEFRSVLGVLFYVAVWLLVAAVLGWFLQSLVVIIVSRSHEKTKPSS